MANSDVVRSVYENFNSRNIQAVLDIVTEDSQLIDMALGMTWQGKAGWKEWLEGWATTAPDAQTEVTNLIADGDTIASEHTGRGTHTGPLPTPGGIIPATNRPFELKFAEIFQLRGGKIAVMKAYWDSASLMRQLGLI